MYISLAQAKQHLLIDESFKEDDSYILDLISVAEDSVAQHLNIALSGLEKEDGKLPSSIIHAMLLMIGNLYANREPVTYGSCIELPMSYKYLLGLYKNYGC